MSSCFLRSCFAPSAPAQRAFVSGPRFINRLRLCWLGPHERRACRSRCTIVGGSTPALSREAIASGGPHSTANKGVVRTARTDFQYGPQPLIPRCESRFRSLNQRTVSLGGQNARKRSKHSPSQSKIRTKPCNKDLCRAGRHHPMLTH